MSVQIAVLAPMHRASESAATARKTGYLRRLRRAYRKSCRIGAIVRNTAQCGKSYLRKPRNHTFLTFFPLTIYRSRHNLLVDCLEKRGGTKPNAETKERSATGHARSVDPQDAGTGADARLGHLAAHPAGFRRRPPGQSRIALPGASTAVRSS